MVMLSAGPNGNGAACHAPTTLIVLVKLVVGAFVPSSVPVIEHVGDVVDNAHCCATKVNGFPVGWFMDTVRGLLWGMDCSPVVGES